MITPSRSDRFIPFTKSDVVEMCLKDGQLTETDKKAFEDFCRILEALFHYEFHSHLEKLKTCYGPFNPDADTRFISCYSESEKKDLRKQLVSEMTTVLQAANFERITAEDLKQALTEESLFQIRLEVDFDDFEDIIFFRRGKSIKEETRVKFFGLLYFKNLDNNMGVFYHLIDAAEEEEIKEAVLAYYFLLTANETLTKKELDRRIENWLAEEWNCHIDFEIGDAIDKLERLKLIRSEADRLHCLPLNTAKQHLDSVWDNFFQFNP